MSARVVDVASVPLPSGTYAEEVEAFDGACLRIVHYGGPGTRGTALIIPGWAEPSEKYAEVAFDLIDRGFKVVCCDPRGQGLSQRCTDEDGRCRIDDFQKHVHDLGTIVDHLGADRLTLVCHSLGGLIGLSWLAGGGHADAVALSAPATRIIPSPLTRGLARGLAGVLVAAGLGDQPLPRKNNAMTFEGNSLTSDPARHGVLRDLLIADEALALPQVNFHVVKAIHEAQALLQKPEVIAKLPAPILLVSAALDSWVDPTHHDILAKRYPDVFDVVKVEGALHELFMEQDQYRDQFWDAFDLYIDKMIPKEAAEPQTVSADST